MRAGGAFLWKTPHLNTHFESMCTLIFFFFPNGVGYIKRCLEAKWSRELRYSLRKSCCLGVRGRRRVGAPDWAARMADRSDLEKITVRLKPDVDSQFTATANALYHNSEWIYQLTIIFWTCEFCCDRSFNRQAILIQLFSVFLPKINK